MRLGGGGGSERGLLLRLAVEEAGELERLDLLLVLETAHLEGELHARAHLLQPLIRRLQLPLRRFQCKRIFRSDALI